MPVQMETAFTPEELEQALNLAWSTGRLNYLMRNTQRQIKEAWLLAKTVSRKFYMECTRRLGKSSQLLILMTEECKQAPRRKCVFFAPVKEGLLDYIEPIIEETYADCPTHLRPTFDRQRFMLRFDNGSRILFRGANNKQHRVRRGLGAHLIGIDEAREIHDLVELIDSIIMPALFSNNGYLLISSTPADTRSHPLFQLRTRAKVEGWFIEITIWDANRMDPDVYSLDRINEWKEETLRSPDGQEIWEREYECKWVINRRKMAVPEWNSASMVVAPGHDPYYQFYRHFHGLDWGYKDFTAIVFATLNFRKGRLEFDGELTYSGKDVRSDLISEKINRHSEHFWGKDFKVHSQVSDSADPILINEINRYDKMNFIPVVKAHTLDAMLNEFRILVSQGKIVVSPTCQMLIHCLETAVWTDKRDKLDQDVFAHHFDHLMAAVYLTRMINWNDNPIPKDFMIDNVRVMELNFDKKGLATTKGGRALERAFGGLRNARS